MVPLLNESGMQTWDETQEDSEEEEGALVRPSVKRAVNEIALTLEQER